MLACSIHRECRSLQPYSTKMSEEGSLTSQQDQTLQSKSHQSTEEQQFVRSGNQMSAITYKHTSEAAEKVKPATSQSTRVPSSFRDVSTAVTIAIYLESLKSTQVDPKRQRWLWWWRGHAHGAQTLRTCLTWTFLCHYWGSWGLPSRQKEIFNQFHGYF